MSSMFLDIETIAAEPAQYEFLRTLYQKKKDREGSFEGYVAFTSLNGNFGRIICIGYAQDKNPVEVLAGDEKEILTKFWELAKTTSQFVGHNLFDFDMRFIMKRSVIHNVRPTVPINFARYRSSPLYDTMMEWEHWAPGARVSLSALGHILGIDHDKGGVDGSDVARLYAEGKIKEIKAYCARDVEMVRAIYHRMTFES